VGAAAEFSAADSRADAAAVRAQLAQLLAAMPVGDRDVLLLLAWADMTYPEVAQALGIPVWAPSAPASTGPGGSCGRCWTAEI